MNTIIWVIIGVVVVGIAGYLVWAYSNKKWPF